MLRKIKLGLAVALVGLGLATFGEAKAQVAQNYWQCGKNANGSLVWCPAGPGADNDVAVTPTVTAGAYSSGQSLGGLMTFPLWRTTVQPSGVTSHLFVASKGGATAAMVAYVFASNPSASTCTNGAALVLDPTDVAKLAMAPIALTPAAGAGSTVTFAEAAIPRAFRNSEAVPSRNVYVCLVAGAAITPASTTDLVVHLGGIQD